MDVFDHMHPGSFSGLAPAPVVETFSPPEGFERNQLFVAQTRHFIETVRGEAEPVCSMEDGIQVLCLVLEKQEKAPR
jgi:hypothetical protein